MPYESRHTDLLILHLRLPGTCGAKINVKQTSLVLHISLHNSVTRPSFKNQGGVFFFRWPRIATEILGGNVQGGSNFKAFISTC